MRQVLVVGLVGLLICGAYWCGLQDGLNRQPQAYFYAPQPPEPFWPTKYSLVLFDTFWLRNDRRVTWKNTTISFDESESRVTVEGNCGDMKEK